MQICLFEDICTYTKGKNEYTGFPSTIYQKQFSDRMKTPLTCHISIIFVVIDWAN